MVSMQQAYALAKNDMPNAKFMDICVDYKDTWAFPYEYDYGNEIPTGERIFVVKNTGEIFRNDPLFNVSLWVKSKSYPVI